MTHYHVEPIPRSLMADFVAAHHYAVRVPPHCLLSLGCFSGGNLVGVASGAVRGVLVEIRASGWTGIAAPWGPWTGGNRSGGAGFCA